MQKTRLRRLDGKKPQKIEGRDALEILNPKLGKLLTRAIDALKANDLVRALDLFGQCAVIEPENKAVLYFGGDAVQQAYFKLRHADPPAPADKLEQWRNAAWTLIWAMAEAFPEDPIAVHNAGRFLHDDGMDADAIAWYRRALSIKREQVESWGNLGTCLYTLGNVAEAELCWSKAVAFEADSPSATVAQAYVWLRRGDYLRGWKALNQRWTDAAFSASYGRNDLGGKPWTGQPLSRKDKLLVHGEQGLGDHVQFARYIVDLIARRINVVGIETRAPLKRWMEACFPDIPVYVRDTDKLPSFTHHVPMMSLPGLLGLEDIPRPTYADSAEWIPNPARQGNMRVGLIWYGTTGNPIDAQRSIPHDQLQHLSDIPGVSWVPMQYDPTGEADLNARAWLGKNVEPAPVFRDVLGMAEAMRDLDTVVAVDTLGAHVAGSIGVPTLLLHRFNREWRWGQHEEATPWYPSVTQLTQAKPGEWAGMLAQVRARLSGG